MKKNLLTKIRNRKGFTLAELLIVVAIIGVLVAVSIPIFTSQLEKAREATDAANERAAKAAVVSAYLTEDSMLFTDGAWNGANGADIKLYYDAPAGKLASAKTGKAYGKGTKSGELADENAGKELEITVKSDGTVEMTWVK